MPDVFISHASEDKDAIARPLAELLRRRDCDVWYDDISLSLGDSLRREIDRGLAASRFGVVILSPAFFRKDWPQRELDGLVTRESLEGTKRILPVWHQVTVQDVARFSPMLADRLGISTARGLDAVADAILQALGRPAAPRPAPPEPPDDELREAVGLASDYLLPQSLVFSEAVAAVIRESLTESQVTPSRRMIAKYVRSADAAERVVGYITCQVAAGLGQDITPFTLELVAAMAREKEEAAHRRETRPLWQLLVALDHVLRSPAVGAKANHVRDALAEMLRFLHQDGAIDPGGECKGMIQFLLNR